MTLTERFADARSRYDAGALDNDGFRDEVNAILADLKNVSDASKIKAYDALADFLSRALRIVELDNGVQYVRDIDGYFFERVLVGTFGADFFEKFYNKTYEGT